MVWAIPYAVAAAGAVYQARGQAANAKYAAAIDDQNAKLARQQASAAEELQRRQGAQVMGNVRASAVESGFDPNAGTLLNIQTKTAGEIELDALTTRYRGELEGLGLTQSAAANRANARTATTQGYLNAAGTLAQGAAKYWEMSRIPPAAPKSDGTQYGGMGRGGNGGGRS